MKNRVKEVVNGIPEGVINPYKPLSNDYLQKINAYWRAANYISVGQIYL